MSDSNNDSIKERVKEIIDAACGLIKSATKAALTVKNKLILGEINEEIKTFNKEIDQLTIQIDNELEEMEDESIEKDDNPSALNEMLKCINCGKDINECSGFCDEI